MKKNLLLTLLAFVFVNGLSAMMIDSLKLTDEQEAEAIKMRWITFRRDCSPARAAGIPVQNNIANAIQEAPIQERHIQEVDLEASERQVAAFDAFQRELSNFEAAQRAAEKERGQDRTARNAFAALQKKAVAELARSEDIRKQRNQEEKQDSN